MHLQIEGRKLLFKLTFLTPEGRPLDIDTTTIYDGSRTYWGSHNGKTGLALQFQGLAIDKLLFAVEGLGLPFLGFDYPGVIFTRTKFAVASSAADNPSYKRYVGQMIVGSDHSVDPPVAKYSDLVAIRKDRDGRIVQCGSVINGVPVDLWTLSRYRVIAGVPVATQVRHQSGDILLARGMPMKLSIRPEDVGNVTIRNVTVRNNYQADFELVSGG